jgi:MFS family permease
MAQRWKVLLITSVGLFMASLDLFIVNIAFPDLARDFEGASLPSLSWVLNAYAIVFAALLVPAGRVADRVGRKRVFVTGLTAFSAPVIELPLLRVHSFALANLAALVFFAWFGAMLLSGVLLLTEVWGYSALEAGFALSPGPLTAAAFAIPSGRLEGKIGQRPVATAGGLTFAAGFAYILASVGPNPEYASTFLPGFVLGGAGVGMTLGTLPAAAAAGLPPSRFAIGTAVFSMARQLGAEIGVAALVALLPELAPRRSAA